MSASCFHLILWSLGFKKIKMRFLFGKSCRGQPSFQGEMKIPESQEPCFPCGPCCGHSLCTVPSGSHWLFLELLSPRQQKLLLQRATRTEFRGKPVTTVSGSVQRVYPSSCGGTYPLFLWFYGECTPALIPTVLFSSGFERGQNPS